MNKRWLSCCVVCSALLFYPIFGSFRYGLQKGVDLANNHHYHPQQLHVHNNNNGRLELKCCKCGGGDKDQNNNFANSTCPINFDETSITNVVGCQNGEKEFSASSSLLLTSNRKWEKCCCSPYFCKFMPSLSTSSLFRRNRTDNPHLRWNGPGQNWINALALMEAVSKFLLQTLFSLAGALAIIEVVLAFMVDPTNLWNELRPQPIDEHHVLAGVVETIIRSFKIVAASP